MLGAVASGNDAPRNALSAQGGQRVDESGVHAQGASVLIARVRGNPNTEAFGHTSDHGEDVSDDSGSPAPTPTMMKKKIQAGTGMNSNA